MDLSTTKTPGLRDQSIGSNEDTSIIQLKRQVEARELADRILSSMIHEYSPNACYPQFLHTDLMKCGEGVWQDPLSGPIVCDQIKEPLSTRNIEGFEAEGGHATFDVLMNGTIYAGTKRRLSTTETAGMPPRKSSKSAPSGG